MKSCPCWLRFKGGDSKGRVQGRLFITGRTKFLAVAFVEAISPGEKAGGKVNSVSAGPCELGFMGEDGKSGAQGGRLFVTGRTKLLTVAFVEAMTPGSKQV